MKNLILIGILTIVSNLTFSQKTENIIGKLKFKDVYKDKKLDSNTSKMLKTLFGDYSLCI